MAVRMFYGEFRVEPPLRIEHREYLFMFNRTRRLRRDPVKLADRLDPLRIAAGLPVGLEGAYYVGAGEYSGGWGDDSVLDQNEPPGMPSMHDYVNRDHMTEEEFSAGLRARADAAHEVRMSGNAQPDLWCQWTPTEDGRAIVWDGGEKFDRPYEWIEYLLRHFLVPWGYVVNGRVEWEGAYEGETGLVWVVDNTMR